MSRGPEHGGTVAPLGAVVKARAARPAASRFGRWDTLTGAMARPWALAIAVAVLLGSVGCGSTPAERTTAARKPAAPDRRPALRKCLKQAMIRVVARGAVPARARAPRVAVPARYVGAAILPRGGVAHLWLADSRANAVRAAAALNVALSRRGGSVAGYAEARGKAVSALAARVRVGDLSDAAALDRCLALAGT
jgi:hypothetical protein